MWKRYLLKVIESNQAASISLRNKKYIDLVVKPWTNREQKAKVVKERHRSELKSILPSFITKWQQVVWVKADYRRVQQMKTKRWSCSIENKRILLNLELAKKSPQCIEYVVVHELIHLLERTHNDKFVAHMDKFLPNWRQLKDELNSWPLSIDDWVN
jgi:predicted metal-dependent hydrolase